MTLGRSAVIASNDMPIRNRISKEREMFIAVKLQEDAVIAGCSVSEKLFLAGRIPQ
jgi:hypothetical protein